ncbi:MAG: signal peptidase I [Nitrospiria bacterium]
MKKRGKRPAANRTGKAAFIAWLFVLVLIGTNTLLALSGVTIGINPTASQPYRFFLILEGRPFVRGDLVAFRFPGSRYYKEGTLFVKEVKGMPGDLLEIREDKAVRLNGEYLDEARAADSNGEAVGPFHFNGIIPEGSYFFYAPFINSYDSRYYGLIKEGRIVGRVIPLI